MVYRHGPSSSSVQADQIENATIDKYGALFRKVFKIQDHDTFTFETWSSSVWLGRFAY